VRNGHFFEDFFAGLPRRGNQGRKWPASGCDGSSWPFPLLPASVTLADDSRLADAAWRFFAKFLRLSCVRPLARVRR
jgi:hypothetical protein